MRKINLMPQLKPFIEQSFEDKYAMTNVIIQRQLREHPNKMAIAWSGGKDSTIIVYLVIRFEPHIPIIFNNTGIEYPETITFVHNTATAWNLNLVETKPLKTFWQCVSEYGFPKTKNAGAGVKGTKRCCYWLKEKPALLAYRELKIEGVFTGITAVESRNRQLNAVQRGTCYVLKHEGLVHSSPILYWTPDDVWHYATENRIKMNDIYSKGADRCGCSCCTAFLSWESQLRAINPKLYSLVKLRKDGQFVMNGVNINASN